MASQVKLGARTHLLTPIASAMRVTVYVRPVGSVSLYRAAGLLVNDTAYARFRSALEVKHG